MVGDIHVGRGAELDMYQDNFGMASKTEAAQPVTQILPR
jgi:hypothetical protein